MSRGTSGEEKLSAQETKSETVGFRLSPQQERLLRVDDDTSVVQCAVALSGPVREPDLRAGLAEVVGRHEIFRTTFPRAVGMRDRSQVIHDSLAPGWTTEAGVPDESIGEHARLSSLMAREAQSRFDLDHGPLVRALLRGPEQQLCLFVLTAHAACADAASLWAILDELAASYRGASEPGEPVQYADYAEWRHDLITGEDADASDGRAFWLRHHEHRPAKPKLLFADPRQRSGNSLAVPIPFSAEECSRLSDAAGSAGVSAPLFLEAAWHALLARLTGARELVLAGWSGGRAQPDLERAVGAYAQPLPIRSRLQSGMSFAEVLDQVRRARAEAERWQDLAGAEDLSELGGASAGGFVHHDLGRPADPVLEILGLNPSSDTPLLLASRAGAGGLSVELWHDPAVHGEQDATELAARLRTLVLSAVSDPAGPVEQLELTGAGERERLVAAAAGPAPMADAGTPVARLFERQARLTPDRPAVAGAGTELSYAELNAVANRLAHLLRDAGVQRNVTVGLCLERSPRLIQAVLGIHKAGGAYLPINHEHPQARIAHQLAESGVKVLVTAEDLLPSLPAFGGEIVCLDRDADRLANFPAHDPEQISRPEDLAYVMYTSGSTGLPKGVLVTQGNLGNYATAIADRLGSRAGEATGMRFGVVTAISTDLGNTGIFPPLISGGCVQMISPGASMDAEAMVAECDGHPLDVLKITPSHLGALLASEQPAGALPRRWLVLGGEALSWELVERIRALPVSCAIVNHYGPTETTIGCCAHDIQERRVDTATVPIGRPLAGARAYVLDRGLALLPPGVPGELCIAGSGVAAGYAGHEDDREGPFVADPFTGAAGARMYKTGDRARYLRDGAIEFLGRIDDQVKIRGFRIEPGEVEAVLGRHPAVRQAAVVPEPDDRNELRLVAYISAGGDPTVEELQAFLAESLPEYMVPGTFAQLEALPFTPSGKIDRQALAGLATVQMRREAQYVAPRDPIEEQIAGIWAELLGTEAVGVFDDFFALGGHSLLATQAIMRIRREHADIPLRALLAAPTVATLAEVVRGGPIEE
ncbi:MAG: amino acid adenylation domain-containing protein [Actinomycetota bacterium]|nr:amino acid adenylation domain-containing protein [Actinomycetota bacterium]